VTYRPKLIATDLDGTIVQHSGVITDRTKAAFDSANNLGIEIFFVTGRPPRWMPEIKATFDYGKAICGNGAMLWDLHEEKVLESWLIPVDAQIQTVDRLRSSIPEVTFAVESHGYFHRETKYLARWDAGLDLHGVADIAEIMKEPALKLLVRSADQSLSSDEMLEIAQRDLADLVTVTHSNSHDSVLEISALGISKGSTLAKIAQRHGIGPEDAVAFGDNPNDFTMLQWAARSYAMADGHPEGFKFAKFVAAPCVEDGVAQVIEELIKLPIR
jgi:Cof subfamily protein (haloacid dehalogenase superfamily)